MAVALPKNARFGRGPSKYAAVPTNGYHSAKESRRAAELKLLAKSGRIRNLREQVKFELIPKQVGERSCVSILDFVYEQQQEDGTWATVCEDTKGFKTPSWVIKRKLLLFVHGIRVLET